MSTPATAATDVTVSNPHSATALALGISLAVVATIVLGGLALYFVRRHIRRKKFQERVEEMSSNRRTYMVSVDPSHLAARVTPFGVNAPEVPKFVHTPGQNMRVAYRRSDGGWSFHETAPDPSVDLQREVTTMYYTCSNYSGSKERKLRPGELTTRGYVEGGEGNSPPAYYHDGSVVSDDPISEPRSEHVLVVH